MPTASFLIIGDEILSGRTQDKNLNTLALFLSERGIGLIEARVVGDREEAIISALNALRHSTDYVFTSGGIGPTHDDITADSVAKAFQVGMSIRDEAVAMMKARYPELEMNEARLRMARIPDGAELIDNSVSGAPGFVIGNVHVMAGVPRIMQAMLETLAPRLPAGAPVLSETISTHGLKEGDYAGALRELAATYPDVSMGSYPHMTDDGTVNTLVLRSNDENALARAAGSVKMMLAGLKASEEGSTT